MRIGICGAGGRMGREVCRAVAADPYLELVCAVDPEYTNALLVELLPELSTDLRITGDLEALVESGVEAMVEFSIAKAARENIPFALERGIHCVVGTTGINQDDIESFEAIASRRKIGCLVAPNFAIGAVLMMDFARKAGRYMEDCEIVELHHQAKLDAPSGTARNTVLLILEGRGVENAAETEEGPRGLVIGDIHVHSVRLPGLVAHQEVIFGGQGQSLTIRHDSFDRTSFMPGVILALRKISEIKGLVIGLEKILDL
jgi:4-hydroxy-tetrahydrodipicolinate reductase